MNIGRKPTDIQIKKNQYIAHIKKIQQLKSSSNPFHRSLLKERQEIDSLIRQTHRMHENSLKLQLKRRENSQINTQRSNYDSVKSIIRKELNRKILNVPQKHKADSYFVDMANLKMVNKILSIKSQFNFKKQIIEQMAISQMKKAKRVDTSGDFSEIYKKSLINSVKAKKIYLKLDKSKQNIKFGMKFLDHQNIFQYKHGTQYTIHIQCDKKHKQSKMYTLDQMVTSQLVFCIPPKECTITLVQKINCKDIPRFRIILRQDQLKQDNCVWISKTIEDIKHRSIGLVQIELKQKKKKILQLDEQGQQHKFQDKKIILQENSTIKSRQKNAEH